MAPGPASNRNSPGPCWAQRFLRPMANLQRIAVVVGARPNFIKAAPVMREFLKRSHQFEPILIHTGQHYDASMSDVFFRDLGIPEPHYHLGCSGATHAQTV